MSELEILQQLERDTGLLAHVGDVEQMRESSYQFTVAAVRRLRRYGYALLKAPAGGNQINGVRIDKIIRKMDLERFDIIVNADDPSPGAPARRACFEPLGPGAAWEVVEAPDVELPPEAPPIVPPATAPPDSATLALMALIGTLHDQFGSLGVAVAELNRRLSELQRDGLKLRLR